MPQRSFQFEPGRYVRWAMGMLLILIAISAMAQEAILPSWNEGPSRRAIVSFVQDVTKEGGEHFVPVSERIAVFDNDGTLWSEQPLYFEVMYSLDQVKVMAPRHPEWKTRQPFNLEMLQWVADGSGRRFAGLVHHTDAAREWAYDRDSKIGRLDKALDVARRRDWVVVDMKDEWKRIYSFDAPR
nr:hypothetical protein [Bordetella sp. H567]